MMILRRALHAFSAVYWGCGLALLLVPRWILEDWFGQPPYPDYSYEYQAQQYQSNGLLQVDIIVNRRGLRKPVDALSIWVYNPDAKQGFGPAFR